MAPKNEPEQGKAAATGTSATVMIVTLCGISMISGVLISLAFQATLPAIKANKHKYLMKSVLEVIPGATKAETFAPQGAGIERVNPDQETEVRYFAGYREDGSLAGLALEAAGQGFQDIIRVIYGYDAEKQQIVGFRVLETKETPGLGDKIEKPPFTDNFKAFDVSLNPDNTALAHPVEVVKNGQKQNPWQIDGITGATISSKAIGKLMLKSTNEHLPLLRKNLQSFKEAR